MLHRSVVRHVANELEKPEALPGQKAADPDDGSLALDRAEALSSEDSPTYWLIQTDGFVVPCVRLQTPQ